MFKYLIIWNILGLIIIGTESKAVTKSCYDYGYYIPNEPTGREKIGEYRRPFYRLILKSDYHLILQCAKEFTDALIDKDHPIRPCIWQDNLKYCSNTVFANVDCRNEVNKLVQFTIEELQNQGKKVPMCFKEDSKTDSKGLGLTMGYW